MKRRELRAWLGRRPDPLPEPPPSPDDDAPPTPPPPPADGLNDAQFEELLAIATAIEDRWPDRDESALASAALTVAYRLMVEEPQEVIAELGNTLVQARMAEAEALAALQQAAVLLVQPGRSSRGLRSQAGFATAANVERSTVRDWLGLSRTGGEQ